MQIELTGGRLPWHDIADMKQVGTTKWQPGKSIPIIENRISLECLFWRHKLINNPGKVEAFIFNLEVGQMKQQYRASPFMLFTPLCPTNEFAQILRIFDGLKYYDTP